MRDTWKAAKVGLLVVAALIAAWGVYRLVEERGSGDGGYTVWAVFTDASGLVPKSRVLIAGIEVGYIDKIRLWGSRARIDIHVDDGIALYEDGLVAKRTASILGEAQLVLAPGTPGRRQLADGDRINTAPESGGTDQIMENVAAASESIRAIAAQMERAFGNDEAGNQMASALRNLTEGLEGVNRTIQTNEQVINRTLANIEETTDTAGPQLVRVLANLESITGDVREIVDENRDGIRQGVGQVPETIASINRAATQLEAVLADIRTITDRTAQGEGTIGRLTSDETLIDEIEGVAEGVGDIVGGIGRLQTIVQLRSEYNFLANSFKNYVGVRLQPREDRYYYIELINDPRGLTEFSETTIRTSPPSAGEPQTQHETRITTRDAFRFSLLFAKRIHFATFRFGIIESTGGLGVDFHLFDDRFELNTDLFAFGERANPRLRVRAAYEVVQRLWILGGVDDILNGGENTTADTSDFFLGAMLRFNDEDLKSILPFAGGVAPGGG
jgi:phospholipid/cholesterol/gamma-HCH transport system substrate-binding protein